MVFDYAGKYLYITTSDGFVKGYNLGTGQIDRSYALGGSLNGIDIARDDSFLLVAQSATTSTHGLFEKISLPGGTITALGYPLVNGEAGGWDVVIASNKLAFITTEGNGGPLRQINLATNAVTVRADLPQESSQINPHTQIHRSADGTRLYFLQGDYSDGLVFTYGALTNSFGPEVVTGRILNSASAAVSHDGSLLATQMYLATASLDTAPWLHFVRSLDHFDNAITFDGLRDICYGVNTASQQVIAYDTRRFIELFRMTIGEAPTGPVAQFDAGMFVASPNGQFLALESGSGIRLFGLPAVIPTPSPTPTPVLSTPRDMVFDHAGRYLYVSTSDGFIFPYDLASAQYRTPYYLGGSLNGIDIAFDDSFLLAAQNNTGLAEGIVQKLDLANGVVTNIPYALERWEPGSGSWDIAIASTGIAMFTERYWGIGDTPLHELQLDTNIITVRHDATPFLGLCTQDTQIQRGADGRHFLFLESNVSNGPVFSYDATTDLFGPEVDTDTNMTSSSGSVSRNGTLVALRLDGSSTASLDTPPKFQLVHSFNGIDSGVAFDAVRDRFYGVNSSTGEIVGYDTNSFARVFHTSIGETVTPGTTQFGEGSLVAGPNGQYLAMRTASTTRVFTVGTATATPTPGPTATPNRLGNISTRALVQTGENVLIGGFILGGTDSKNVVVRAIGPSLAQYGIVGALQDPVLELRDQTGTLIGSNNNWGDFQRTQIQQAGYAPKDPREAALLITLSPGSYTIIVRGANNSTGVGLVEVYDLQLMSYSALTNISTRAFIGLRDNVAIAGLIVRGSSKRVLVRGIGPTLSQYGISNALQDPALELHDGNGTLIAQNDDWRDTQEQEIGATLLGPPDDREAAMLSSLPPGNYTAILRGKNNSTGVGLVECYSLPH